MKIKEDHKPARRLTGRFFLARIMPFQREAQGSVFFMREEKKEEQNESI